MKEHDYFFRLHLCGDSGVGKTSLLAQFAKCIYNENPVSTVSLSFERTTIESLGHQCQLQISDCGGEERFRILQSEHYQRHGVILCYNTRDQVSFERLGLWIDAIRRGNGKDIPILLVGTKVDLDYSTDSRRAIDYKTAIAFADEQGLIGCIEVSAKSTKNVDKVFESFTEHLLKKGGVAQKKPPIATDIKPPLLGSSDKKTLNDINIEIDEKIKSLKGFCFFFSSGANKAIALENLKYYINENHKDGTDLKDLINKWKAKTVALPNGKEVACGEIINENRSFFIKREVTKTEIMINQIANYEIKIN